MNILNPLDLERFGLTEKEALVYSHLLEKGASSVASISTGTHNKKGNTYNILQSLLKSGLVEQSQEKPKALFRVTDPSFFRALIQKQQSAAQENAQLLENLLPQLITTYTTTTHVPSVKVLEGVEGFAEHYRAILQEKPSELLLLRSQFDHATPEIRAIIDKTVVERRRAKIFTRIIGRTPDEMYLDHEEYNKRFFIDRRFTASPLLTKLPAQIQIWNDSVAITSFRKPYLVSVITNAAIAETFRSIFEFLWVQCDQEHAEILATLLD